MSEIYNQAVGGILIKDNMVLLVKHTYGSAKGKYLIPGGYLHDNELPVEAVE